MKKIDKNQIFTVILGIVMLVLSLESIRFVCEGFSYLILGQKGAGVALEIVTGFLLLAPLTFFGFKLLDKGCKKLDAIAALTNLAVIITVFIFAICLAAAKTYALEAVSFMIVDLLLVISWVLLDFATFKGFVSSFKIVKVTAKVAEPEKEETEEVVEEKEEISEETTKEE